MITKRPLSAAPWKTPKKEDWKIKKNKDMPDCGTYEASTSKKFVMKSNQSVSITKTNILTFSGQMAKDKAFVPPAGSYNPEKCYTFISRPGMKKRV